jgi:hypothetical protein
MSNDFVNLCSHKFEILLQCLSSSVPSCEREKFEPLHTIDITRYYTFSGKVPEPDSYRSMRRRVPVQSPTKSFDPLSHRENGHHVRENGKRSSPQENSYHGNVFQRGVPGRQSLPVNQNNRVYVTEQFGNMYYGSQRPPNATPTRTAVNNSYNNLGKV